MRYVMMVAALATWFGLQPVQVFAQAAPAPGSSLGTVTLPQRVLANGQPLAAGTYEVRLAGEAPAPGVGQSPEGSRYVEFVRGDQVAGREMATVVSGAEVAQVAKGGTPRPGSARVDMLRGNDYLRVWINRAGVSYIIHMPPQR